MTWNKRLSSSKFFHSLQEASDLSDFKVRTVHLQCMQFSPGIPPWKGGAKDDLLRKAPTVKAMTWHGQYKRQTQDRLNTSKTCALKTTVTSIFALALWEVSQKVIFKNSPNFPFINFLVWKICGFPSETTAFLGGLNNRDKTRPCREE